MKRYYLIKKGDKMNLEGNITKINGFIEAKIQTMSPFLSDEDKEDIKQDCFLKLVKSQTEPDKLNGYISKVVENRLIDWKHKNRLTRSLNDRVIPIEEDENNDTLWVERMETVTNPLEREYFPKSNLAKPVEDMALTKMDIEKLQNVLSENEKKILYCIINEVETEEGMQITNCQTDSNYYVKIFRLREKIKQILIDN